MSWSGTYNLRPKPVRVRYWQSRKPVKLRRYQRWLSNQGNRSVLDFAMANPDYFAKFGEFIHWYASVERIVHYVFRHFSGLPQEAARTIDGGMALSALISLIRRIVVARKVSEAERNELELLFDHLGHITLLRDTLIHRGGESLGERVIATNYHVARSEIDFEYIELNLSDIKDAALIARKCTCGLSD